MTIYYNYILVCYIIFYTYIWNIIQQVKEENPAICTKVVGPRGLYAKWNKPQERQIMYGITYMWTLFPVLSQYIFGNLPLLRVGYHNIA